MKDALQVAMVVGSRGIAFGGFDPLIGQARAQQAMVEALKCTAYALKFRSTLT